MVSMRQATAWTASNIRYTPFRMKWILASLIHNAERPRMAKYGETQTRRWVPFGLGPILSVRNVVPTLTSNER
jgi:hypothetical protein